MPILENNKQKIITLIFSILPLSFIGGNPFINLNIILLIFFSLIFFNKRIFNIDFNIFDKLMFLFFLTLLLTGTLNSIFFYFPEKSIYSGEIILKSFFFLRFILLYFIIRFLLYNKILDLKFFFIAASLCCLFVSLDVILQFVTGKDIFGYESFSRKYPGPFGDEAISGSYLQRFSLFILFLIPAFFPKLKSKGPLTLAFLTFILFFCATLLSGNKFPFVMLFLSLLILLSILIESKKFILFLIFFSLIFFVFYKNSTEVRNNFSNFYNKISQVQIYSTNVISSFKYGTEIDIPNVWLKEMHNGVIAFNTKKIFGGGVKSFKVSCIKVAKYSCAPHPHNYHIEILISVGVFGYLILMIIFLKYFYNIRVKKYFISKKSESLVLLIFSTLFFIEYFPLRTTGSFFSTGNATYFFIIMSIAISLTFKKIDK